MINLKKSFFLVFILIFNLCPIPTTFASTLNSQSTNNTLIHTLTIHAITTPPAVTPPQNPDFNNGLITSITHSAFLSNLPIQDVLVDTDLSYIYYLAQEVISPVDATVEKNNGSSDTLSLDVVWDYSKIDLHTPGLYYATGTIVPPEGYFFKEGVLQLIKIPVEVILPSEGPYELTYINNYDVIFKGKMFALDDTHCWEDQLLLLNEHLMFITAYCTDPTTPSIIREAPLSLENLDTSHVNIHQKGEYTITVSLKLDEAYAKDFILPESLSTVYIPVKVSDPTNFEIWLTGASADMFYLTWVNPIKEISDILYLVSDTPLTEEVLSSANWQSAPTNMAVAGGQNFRISRTAITLHKHYYFRLKSEDTLSNIIHLLDDGSSIHSNYIGGDRDGGDSGGIKPPTITQTPPEYPTYDDVSNDVPSSASNTTSSTPDPLTASTYTKIIRSDTTLFSIVTRLNSAINRRKLSQLNNTPDVINTTQSTTITPTPPANPQQATELPEVTTPASYDFMEVFGETEDILSGTRLKLMFKDGGNLARFSKQNIMLSIPESSILPYDLQNTDKIILTLLAPTPNTLQINFSINDVPITSIPDMQLLVPYTLTYSNASLYLQDDKGKTIATGNYDDTTQLITFMLNETGIFKLIDESPVITSNASGEILASETKLIPTNSPTPMPSPTPAVAPTSTIDLIFFMTIFSLLIIIILGFYFFKKRGHK